MFSILRLYFVALLAGAVWAVPFSAQAQTASIPTIAYGASSAVVKMAELAAAGAAFRTFVAAAGSVGGVIIKDAITAKVGSAAGVVMTAARAIPWTQVAVMSARATPYLLAGSVAWSVYDAVRCKASTDGSKSGLMCDPGVVPGMQTQWCVYNNYCNSSKVISAIQWKEFENKGLKGRDVGLCPNNSTQCVIEMYQPPGTAGWHIPVDGSAQKSVAGCAAPDVMGADGRCSGGVAVPQTFEQAAATAEPYIDKSKAVAMAQEASPYVNPIPLGATVPLSGPASIVGAPTTTSVTTPAGVTSTSTTTPTYNMTYGGDTYTYTTINNTTNSDGSTKTDTPAETPKTQCELNPQSAGCADLGTPPASDSIPVANVPITYTPTLFAGSTGCPAAVPLNFSIAGVGKSFSISYDPLCNLMTTLAPIFLALGAASAAMIFMEGLKS